MTHHRPAPTSPPIQRAVLPLLLSTTLLLAGCGSGGSGGSDVQGGVKDQVAALPAGELVAPVKGIDCPADAPAPTGEPIVVGGSLSLTGALAPTAAVHDGVANLVVEWVNTCGGIDGRPLEWRVVDDQSTPAQAAANYERLIADGVDLVMGPYATANILAAAGPVGRAGYAYPTHSNGAPDQTIGEYHFPAWQFGDGATTAEGYYDPSAEKLLAALKATETPPSTAFFATSAFPSTLSMSAAAQRAFKGGGIEVVEALEYELGTTDFSSIALRIQQADPDFVYLGSLGGDISGLYDAFNAIGYTPRGIYATYPAPVAVDQLGSQAEGLMLNSIYENQPPLGDTEVARYFADQYATVAEERGLFPLVETQAAGSFSAWQILLTGVAEAGVDNAAIIEYLNSGSVETIAGTIAFDGPSNYSADFNRVTQVQGGERVLVWPEDVAGATPVNGG